MQERRISRLVAAGVAAAGLLAASGCGDSSKPAAQPAAPPAATAPAPAQPAPAPSLAPEAAKAQADQIFSTRCFTCHGPNGEGNGPASAGLAPPPRNFHDQTWQAAVTDEHIAQIIQYGGAAVGKSPTMPGNPDLISQPAVVAALVAHVRSLGKQ
jgi:mono/diheme cytochrome c family protein